MDKSRIVVLKKYFCVSRYNFRDEIMRRFNTLTNRPSRYAPNVGDAFNHVRTNMFTVKNGDRPRARNYIIILTGNIIYAVYFALLLLGMDSPVCSTLAHQANDPKFNPQYQLAFGLEFVCFPPVTHP